MVVTKGEVGRWHAYNRVAGETSRVLTLPAQRSRKGAIVGWAPNTRENAAGEPGDGAARVGDCVVGYLLGPGCYCWRQW